MEKYSVLMSLYIKEHPEYLQQSIDSILNQTIVPDEIVIVKDGPLTVQLDMVLTNYKKQYGKRFKIIGTETNQGLGLALDYGLNHCRNELIARMDTDDISKPDRCEKQLLCFEKEMSLDIVGGFIQEFNCDNLAGVRSVPLVSDSISVYIKRRCPFNHMTVMFKKSAVVAAGGYKHWSYNEDYYLWIRMFENGCKFRNIPDILVNVRVGDDMYKRRGGWGYFKSEARLQYYMFTHNIIGFARLILNVTQRFILQVLMPNKLRGWVFRKFARK